MISSEVQRTLVKSPPELWTELSDPESLARHLGELGEITITRTEPENLVEWEAEGTTGTVEIASSGWGTRVKLTVLRELEAESDGEEQAAPEAAAPTPAPAPEQEPESLAPVPALAEELEIAAPAPTLEEELQAVASAPAVAGAETALADTAAPAGPEPVTGPPPFELKPAPATEAARRGAGWPHARSETGPAIESDLRAAEEVDGPPREPAGLQEWAAQSAEANAVAGTEPPADQEPDAPEPRRGFFARIFGRRRARRAEAEYAEPVADGPEASEEMNETDVPAADLDDAVAQADEGFADMPAPAGAQDEGADEPAIELAAATPATLEPETAKDPERAQEPERTQQAERAEEPEREPIDAGTEDQETAGHGPEEAAAGEESSLEGPPAVAGAEDLAAELRAAEEVAAEQVEAVLTAVLDRLGSAHHRPFSRS